MLAHSQVYFAQTSRVYFRSVVVCTVVSVEFDVLVWFLAGAMTGMDHLGKLHSSIVPI